MLALLAMLTLVAGKIYSLAEQQRGTTRAQVQRSQATTLLFGMENIVLRKLPMLDVQLFQSLLGKAINDPIRFEFPLPQGHAEALLGSAQQCLNLAPLEEDNPTEKLRTQKILQRLFAKAGIADDVVQKIMTASEDEVFLPTGLRSLLCYLPGAGQHWDIHQLDIRHLQLLTAALPDEHEAVLRHLLKQRLTVADSERINAQLGYDLLVFDSHYYWLTFSLLQTSSTFRGRDLVKIDGRYASVIRRRLLDDDAL